MCIHKLELNFSDFYKYSCISEMNFSKKKHIKITRFVISINLGKDSFPIFWNTASKLLEESQLDFKNQYL